MTLNQIPPATYPSSPVGNVPDPHYDPDPVIGKCTQCGIELHRMMMYSCPRRDCPCFPKVTM